MKMTLAKTSPAELSEAIIAKLGTTATDASVPFDGAARVAELVLSLATTRATEHRLLGLTAPVVRARHR